MGRDSQDAWSTDTSISRPEAPKIPVLVDFDGFGFTMNGMVHNVSEGELEELIIPTFAPEGYQGSEEPIDFEDEARSEEKLKYWRGKDGES